MLLYTDKQSDFQEQEEAQQTADTGKICVTISSSETQTPGIKCLLWGV